MSYTFSGVQTAIKTYSLEIVNEVKIEYEQVLEKVQLTPAPSRAMLTSFTISREYVFMAVCTPSSLDVVADDNAAPVAQSDARR